MSEIPEDNDCDHGEDSAFEYELTAEGMTEICLVCGKVVFIPNEYKYGQDDNGRAVRGSSRTRTR